MKWEVIRGIMEKYIDYIEDAKIYNGSWSFDIMNKDIMRTQANFQNIDKLHILFKNYMLIPIHIAEPEEYYDEASPFFKVTVNNNDEVFDLGLSQFLEGALYCIGKDVIFECGIIPELKIAPETLIKKLQINKLLEAL